MALALDTKQLVLYVVTLTPTGQNWLKDEIVGET